MGCKSNQFEGQIVVQKLVEAGFKEVKKLEGDLARGKNAKAGSFLDLDKSGDI